MTKSTLPLILVIFFIFSVLTSCEKFPPEASFTCDETSGEFPLRVNFTSTSEGDISSFLWEFGDGESAETQNAVHVYNNAGSYKARLTVKGPDGEDSSEKTITVTTPAPGAGFTCDRIAGKAPLTVKFTSSSTGSVSSYDWTFGDGGKSSTQNPTYTYRNAGIYTATLTITGPGGSDSSSKTITVSEPAPIANFMIDKPSGTAPHTVKFTSTSTGKITSYSWTFGDGGTSVSRSPSHTFYNAGTYSVRLKVTGPGGSDSEYKTVTVGEDPGTDLTFYNWSFTDITISINSSISKDVAAGGSVTFNGIKGSSFDYYAYTYGKTRDGNNQIGSKVEWIANDQPISGGTQSFNLNVSSDWFFLYITNNSRYVMEHLYVNYDLTSQTYDNVIIYNNRGKVSLGYYRAFNNSNVRIYNGARTLVWNWTYGTNFTFPWTANQSVSLLGTESESGANEVKMNPSQFSDKPPLNVLPAKPYIQKKSNKAIDLFSK